MRKIPLYCLFFIVFMAPSISHGGMALDFGKGAYYCREFSKFNQSKKNDFMIWVQGFFSAYNALDPTTFNILGDKNYTWVQKQLEERCKAKPDIYFGGAVRDLIEELYPNRIPSEDSKNAVTINIEELKNYKKGQAGSQNTAKPPAP